MARKARVPVLKSSPDCPRRSSKSIEHVRCKVNTSLFKKRFVINNFPAEFFELFCLFAVLTGFVQKVLNRFAHCKLHEMNCIREPEILCSIIYHVQSNCSFFNRGAVRYEKILNFVSKSVDNNLAHHFAQFICTIPTRKTKVTGAFCTKSERIFNQDRYHKTDNCGITRCLPSVECNGLKRSCRNIPANRK